MKSKTILERNVWTLQNDSGCPLALNSIFAKKNDSKESKRKGNGNRRRRQQKKLQ
jgi:hypothetical protein